MDRAPVAAELSSIFNCCHILAGGSGWAKWGKLSWLCRTGESLISRCCCYVTRSRRGGRAIWIEEYQFYFACYRRHLRSVIEESS